jgi:hypothetical protein
LRGCRGDLAHNLIGEASLRQRSETPTVHNRAKNEPRHEDYERRDEMMFTHVISLFFYLFVIGGGSIPNIIFTGFEFQQLDFWPAPFIPCALRDICLP